MIVMFMSFFLVIFQIYLEKNYRFGVRLEIFTRRRGNKIYNFRIK